MSIAPLHSLVASVMKGARQPDLIMRQNVSPHSYHLTPSKAFLLARADVIFWVGKDFEHALGKIIAGLPETASSFAFESTRCAVSSGHADLHIWLDPVNASCMVQQIAVHLARLDAENAGLYQQNAARLLVRLKTLDEELKALLAPLKEKRYLVFHDAYRWFEKRYGLKPAGFFRKTPDRLPGARHIADLRRKISDKKMQCIFTEPGFTPAQIRAIEKETGLKTGVLDPLGVNLRPGPGHYFLLMRNLAHALRACLEG